MSEQKDGAIEFTEGLRDDGERVFTLWSITERGSLNRPATADDLTQALLANPELRMRVLEACPEYVAPPVIEALNETRLALVKRAVAAEAELARLVQEALLIIDATPDDKFCSVRVRDATAWIRAATLSPTASAGGLPASGGAERVTHEQARYPKAAWHGYQCTGSNETGQAGYPCPADGLHSSIQPGYACPECDFRAEPTPPPAEPERPLTVERVSGSHEPSWADFVLGCISKAIGEPHDPATDALIDAISSMRVELIRVELIRVGKVKP